MSRSSFVAAVVVLSLSVVVLPTDAGPLTGSIVSRRGAKCMTAALDATLVASACSGAPSQLFVVNFAVGGLQLGARCMRRNGTAVVLAPCHPGDPAEVFRMNSATLEISNSNGGGACLDLGNAEWRPAQPVTSATCNGTAGQKWLLGEASPARGAGSERAPDAQAEMHPGDFVTLGSRYLVIQ